MCALKRTCTTSPSMDLHCPPKTRRHAPLTCMYAYSWQPPSNTQGIEQLLLGIGVAYLIVPSMITVLPMWCHKFRFQVGGQSQCVGWGGRRGMRGSSGRQGGGSFER